MTAPGRHAGIVSRGIAFGLDALVTVLILLACSVGFSLVSAVFNGSVHNADRLSLGPMLALTPIVFGVYCVLGWSLAGRTFGKALLGLRVVDHAGRHPSVIRSIVRLLGYIVSSIFWLGFIWIAFDSRRDGFHDKIARTHVVYDQTHAARRPPR